MRFEHGKVDFENDVKLQFEINSSDDEKLQFINRILQIIQVDFDVMQTINENKLRLCLDEVLTNAIQHGNNENPVLKIFIKVLFDSFYLGFAVKDEGNGLNANDLPNYSDEEFLEKSLCGRGLMLIDNLVDELIYYIDSKELVFKFRIKSEVTE